MFGHSYFGASYWGPQYWGPTGTVPIIVVTGDTHDGGYLSPEELDELRRRARQAEDSRQTSEQERRRVEHRLTEALDQAYRKVVLNEPELAEAIAAETMPSAFSLERHLGMDWGDLAGQLQAVQRLLAEMEARAARAALMADEDDVEMLLLCAA